MIASDEIFMRRALELARLGQGFVAPNPMVGCVIVHENRIIGEGWHQKYGGLHAEVNAINSVSEKHLLPQSRLYVTLEPCSHYGKTPPCADFLIQNNIRDVVICNTDLNPMVKGAGIRKLLAAGCKVHLGLLEQEGFELNKYFFTFHTKKRPYILLKWAETADGCIGRLDNQKCWITNKLSKMLVHQLRARLPAIMVGTQTALTDDPQLNTREWTGNNPTRIVIDKNLRLPSHLQLFNKEQPTLAYNLVKNEIKENLEYIKLPENVNLLPAILEDLYKRNIQSVLVEGGSKTLNSFIQEVLWDEAYVFKSADKLSEPGLPAPVLPLNNLKHVSQIYTNKLFVYKNNY